jgi:hypothetical protein
MATSLPFPYMPSRTTAALFDGFDPAVFSSSTDSFLYKYLDALAGTTGAGALINQIFLTNLNNAIETCYFNELDYIFGNIKFLARTTAESYTYDPLTDQLTSDEWDEVRVKDAWFRARIKEFFAAVQLGCTPEGIRKIIHAAIACDCTIMEVWRYADNFGLNDPLGRSLSIDHYAATNLVSGYQVFFSTNNQANTFVAAQAAPTQWEVDRVRPRNEVVIKPHKSSISAIENRLLRELLTRLMPMETIVTVDVNGLAVSTPVKVATAAADSCYYEVIKEVVPTPLISKVPPEGLLAVNLSTSERWLLNGDRTVPRVAPYAAFMQTSQYSYYYLTGGGVRSPIDSVTYGTLQDDGSVTRSQNFQTYQQSAAYTDWLRYDKADSPDNYPGGKFGQHPGYAPAVNPDGSPYQFPYESQNAYVSEMITKVQNIGGLADSNRYKIPIQKQQTAAYTYYPEYAVASFPPAKESTVSTSITRLRPRRESGLVRNPSNFVR